MSDLGKLESDFDHAARDLGDELVPIAKKAGVLIKENARLLWRQQFHHGRGHARNMPGTVTFDVIGGGAGADFVGIEVGPDLSIKHRQAELGGLVEEGSTNNAPKPGLYPAYELEIPVFEEQVNKKAGELLDGRR